MITKLSLAAGLSLAFEKVMPEKLQQGDTTAYAALLDDTNQLFFSSSAFDDYHSEVPIQTTALAAETNARIIGYFSAMQLSCFTTEELAEQITDDQIPFS